MQYWAPMISPPGGRRRSNRRRRDETPFARRSMRRFLSALSAVLVALSGARPEVLRTCPTERGKFEGIGGAVLTTSVLAFVSMTFALNSTLGVNIVLAV